MQAACLSGEGSYPGENGSQDSEQKILKRDHRQTMQSTSGDGVLFVIVWVRLSAPSRFLLCKSTLRRCSLTLLRGTCTAGNQVNQGGKTGFPKTQNLIEISIARGFSCYILY